MSSELNILVSSAGRRVELIDCFRSAAAELGCRLRVIAMDTHPDLSAACHRADRACQVPPFTSPEFIERALAIAIEEDVRLVIPTIDPELENFALHSERFAAAGIEVAVSKPDVIKVARDKLELQRFLRELGVATPRTAPVESVLTEPDAWAFPLILKPRAGSASIGVHIAASVDAVRAANIARPAYVAQTSCRGPEYTVNLFFDEAGLRCAIPHRRLEIRGGEVSKAVTERVPALERIAAQLGEAVAGRGRGALCFQAILDESAGATVIDLNARFGGGYPLAHQARANFARWLLEPLLGRPCSANDLWDEGLAMTRYDTSLFFRIAKNPASEQLPGAAIAR